MEMVGLNIGACVGLVLYVCSVIVTAINPTVVQTQIIWEGNTTGEVYLYRIPVIINLPNGDLLAFAEARKYDIPRTDVGAKFIAMKRSKDKGSSWGPTEFIVDDYEAQDGLNLGTAMVDEEMGYIIILYVYCAHNQCPERQNVATNFVVKSKDWGYTWGNPVDLGLQNPDILGFDLSPGPGYGIQKKYAPNKGRLITCGHRTPFALKSVVCFYSDDHGDTWKIGGGLVGIPFGGDKKVGDFAPGEAQVIEYPNGTLLVNARNTHFYHCRCRMHGMSFDGGITFPVTSTKLVPELIEPSVCGSILLHGGTLFFSNPASTSGRFNMTVKWSNDMGESWPGQLPIYLGSSEYSCLSNVDDDHIGLAYEKSDYKLVEFVKIKVH
ncbi:sialidase-1-like [Anneissia japonica]|uniref:sialidase-1-like n=1 Tax=Anneissia japonica TaxID=1529436 RepID=UPI0014259DDE|nr:sialidase-1-like [Anneissia japonica]